ncbi:6248_t:CDS:2 [Dentiscutata heterogama]|uniref:6248_t:CDS:1 n=1 Tax=Dentiscutata heterogama TaxID=1316150 RepID=A0ACA9JXN8_9GLOM|nr:6248_t:CDS:2 [Dentiscutata heterogama]
MDINGSFIESELLSAIIPFTFDGRNNPQTNHADTKIDLADLNPIQD